MAKTQAKKPWEATEAAAEEAAVPSTEPVTAEASTEVTEEPVVEPVVTEEASDEPIVDEDTGEGQEPEPTPEPMVAIEGELLNTVVVVVPKQFILNLDHQKTVTYQAGTQRMEHSHANHWWSKANGVTIFEG